MEKILEAMYFATNKHLEQKRKDKATPYISHPLAVAVILSEITDDEDVIAAGVLHDVMEEAGITKKELISLFGEKVAKIVVACSEQDKTKSWAVRKNETLKSIKTMDSESVLVKTADILHNTYETVRKVKENGTGFFENFNADAKTKIKHERVRIEELKKYHKDNPLLKEIEKNLIFLEKKLSVIPGDVDNGGA
jgi:GTP diphosphokinase / guanosine-3',5'-bis(diphosphate) 3'-diphosphatase